MLIERNVTVIKI